MEAYANVRPASQQAQYAKLDRDTEPLVTLSNVAERHGKIGDSFSEAERKLADILDHVSGLGGSYGDPAGSATQQAPRAGMIGHMRDRADQMDATASRVHQLLNSIMTHLGMNEPSSIKRQA